MKQLPLVAAALHVLVCAYAFLPPLLGHRNAELLPLVAYAVDMPLSPSLAALSETLNAQLGRNDYAAYGLVFLAFGTAWYYLLGWLVRWALRRWLAEHVD
jgi:hypothetical protein